MQSRGNLKRAIAAVVAGVLIGGGVTAVSPAGAEVSQFAATNWKKIWKKKLQPRADKRYYTKSASDAKYSTKTQTGAAFSNYYTKAQTDAALAGYYTKAQADAKYQPVGNYAATGSSYLKAESDGRYVSKRSLLTGPWAMAAAPTGSQPLISINFPAVASAAPTQSYYIAPGAVPPAQCPGTAAAPDAQPGYLCVFGSENANINGHYFFNERADGAVMAAFSTNNASYSWGNWAFRPTGYAAPGMAVKSPVTPLTGSAAGQ